MVSPSRPSSRQLSSNVYRSAACSESQSRSKNTDHSGEIKHRKQAQINE